MIDGPGFIRLAPMVAYTATPSSRRMSSDTSPETATPPSLIHTARSGLPLALVYGWKPAASSLRWTSRR